MSEAAVDTLAESFSSCGIAYSSDRWPVLRAPPYDQVLAIASTC
jgi:hypothetical protein